MSSECNGLPTAAWPEEGPIAGTAFVPRKLRILMLGAGISGLQLAHDVTTQLRNVELEIYEKNAGLGGTWLENRYPGCACDVPAHTYQFSWAPNPRWSKYYAPAPEILAYLNRVADEHDLRRFLHFNHRGVRAEWQEASATWLVTLERTDPATGAVLETTTRTCDVFVQGTGVLNHWTWPAIEGLHSFGGQLLHTACWDAAADLRGKTVAVIGNAASAVQCVAALQPDVAALVNYVRTPAWMLPHTFSDGKVQAEYTEEEKHRFETDPDYYYAHRLGLEKKLATILESMCHGSAAQRELAAATRAHMQAQIQDPRIRGALEPAFEIGCRRHTPGDHYLRALQQPNVRLVTSGIVRVTPRGIVDGSGAETPLDAIVCATGFDASYAPRFPILGRGGYSLADNWGTDTKESYMSALVARFPNHFAFNPPICPVVGSLYPGIEMASAYMLKVLQRVQTDGVRSFCVRDAAQTDFNAWAQSRMPHMAWSGSCRSWYKNDKGKVYVPWPGTMLHYAAASAIVRWEDFDLEFASANKYASFGNGITEDAFAPERFPWLRR